MKQLCAWNYTVPLAFLVWGVVNILFAEKLPANEGLGWDGARYAYMTKELLHSSILDNYYVWRFFPCALAHTLLYIANATFTSANMILAFEAINLISICIVLLYMKKIFNNFKVGLKTQYLGFILYIISYAILKFNFFYPVMTDALAMCFGTMLFYFYLKGQTVNLILVTITGAFTWPVILYQGVIMLAFPNHLSVVPNPLGKVGQIVWSSVSALIAFAAVYYYVVYKAADMDVAFTLKIDHGLLWLSIPALMLIFYFLPKMVLMQEYFSVRSIFNQTTINYLLGAILLFISIKAIMQLFFWNGQFSEYVSADNFVKKTVMYGVVKPFLPTVAHTTYFGSITLLILIFWKRFSYTCAKIGLGLVLALLINLALRATLSETRSMINIFPWLVIIIALTLSRYKFSNYFYVLIISINIILSKVWLPINYSNSTGLDNYGSIAFPNQKFFMNIGQWMSSDMYLLQGTITLIALILIFFSLFGVNLKDEVRLYRKFDLIEK